MTMFVECVLASCTLSHTRNILKKEPREPIFLYEPGVQNFSEFPPRGRGGGGFSGRGRGGGPPRGQVGGGDLFHVGVI